MLAIVAVAFVSELVVAFVVSRWLGVAWPGRLAMLHAVGLALTIAPPVYFLVLRPLRREGERRIAAERLAREADRRALTDPLTGLLNRRGIEASLLGAIAHAERYGRPLAVVMLDLDGFKRVNDVHGHVAGDEILRAAARVIRDQLRSPDRIGRFGGDEFLIVLPETGIAAARNLGERIGAALRGADFAVRGEPLALSASCGLVEFRCDESLASVLERVDVSLYEAKAARPAASREAGAAVPAGQ